MKFGGERSKSLRKASGSSSKEMPAQSEPAWCRAPPSPFDIAAAWFPEKGSEAPGLKLRPSLVLAVYQDENSGMYACDVAFGTKNLKLFKREHLDLIIQNSSHLREFGLHRATRFDLDLVITVPWTTEFFGCWRGHSSPVIGTLTTDYIKEYAYQMLRRQSAGLD